MAIPGQGQKSVRSIMVTLNSLSSKDHEILLTVC